MSITFPENTYNVVMAEQFKFWLREFRSSRGLTQDELGKKFGVTHVTVGIWEKGENRPDPEKLIPFCEAYKDDPDVDVHRLFHMIYGMPLPETGNTSDDEHPRRRRIKRQIDDLSEEEVARLAAYLTHVVPKVGVQKE